MSGGPRFVLGDLPRPAVCGAMIGVAAAWLGARALTGGLGGWLAELDVFAVVLGLFVPVMAALGPRTIVIDDEGIRVSRRGRVVLARRFEEVVGVHALGPASRLVFKDGTWLLWFISGPEWSPATDYVVARVGPQASDGVLRIAADRVRFPPRCLGCGERPEMMVTITARRGVDLLLWAWFVVRGVEAPACPDCDDRRLKLGAALGYGPGVALIGCLFLPFASTTLRGAPVAVLFVILLITFVVLRNRGVEWADAWVWGVRARLAVDGTIELRCRDPRVQAEIAEASAASEPGGAAPASVEV